MLSAALAALVALGGARERPDDDALARWQRSHRQTQLAGMGVLTGWATVNIAAGIAGALTLRDDARFFHQANAAWNSVNLALGIAGLVGAGRRRVFADDLAGAREVVRRTQRVFFANAMADLGYIAAGTIMAIVGQRVASARVQRYGDAVALQGAFLFGFDLAMLIAHDRVARGRLGGPITRLRGRPAR